MIGQQLPACISIHGTKSAPDISCSPALCSTAGAAECRCGRHGPAAKLCLSIACLSSSDIRIRSTSIHRFHICAAATTLIARPVQQRQVWPASGLFYFPYLQMRGQGCNGSGGQWYTQSPLPQALCCLSWGRQPPSACGVLTNLLLLEDRILWVGQDEDQVQGSSICQNLHKTSGGMLWAPCAFLYIRTSCYRHYAQALRKQCAYHTCSKRDG